MGFRESVSSASSGGYQLAQGPCPAIFAESRSLRDCLCGFMDGSKVASSPMKLTLFTEGGRVKACINDPTRDRMGFVTLDESLSLVESIERALEDGGLEWRPRPKRDNQSFRR